MNQDERTKKIEEYRSGYDMLTAALVEIPREAWDFRPAPGEWSIHEVIGHMADSEMIGVVRLYKIIAEPGSTVMAYEPDLWGKSLGWQNGDVNDALEVFRLIRRRTVQMIKTMPHQVYEQSVVHPEYKEPYTFDLWLGIYAPHVTEHIDQIESNYQAWKEQK